MEVVASFADAAALLRRYGAKLVGAAAAEDDAARPAGAAAADRALAEAEDAAVADRALAEAEDAAGADVGPGPTQLPDGEEAQLPDSGEDECALPAAFEAWLRSALPQESGEPLVRHYLSDT